MGPALSDTAYYVAENKSFNDCYALARPGSIQSNPNPELAQTKMAGGRKTMKRRGGLKRGGSCGLKRGGSCGLQRAGSCGLQRGGVCGLQRGGSCGCAMRKSLKKGGKRKTTKKQRGGFSCAMKRGGSRNSRQGTCGYYGARGGRYTIDSSQSIGGDGPNVAPLRSNFPCEAARPMSLNPVIPTMLADSPSPDVNVSGLRPAFIQAGGAPLSLAYNAPRAGFSFMPNISQGQVVNPGQIPYNNVVPQQTTGAGSCGQAINLINKMN